MGAIVVGRGKAQVVVGPELERWVSQVLAKAAPTVIATIESETEKILDKARAEWPVKTGRSKAALTGGIRIVTPFVVDAYVSDNVPYAYYIKGRSQDGKSTWQVLVARPLKAALPAIAAVMAQDLAKAVR